MTPYENDPDEVLVVDYVALRERHKDLSEPEKKAVFEDEIEEVVNEWKRRGNDLSDLLDRECNVTRSDGEIHVELVDEQDEPEDARYRNPPKFHGVEGAPGMDESEIVALPDFTGEPDTEEEFEAELSQDISIGDGGDS